jgi:hypothetical protein
MSNVICVSRMIHEATIHVRNEYPELRLGDASGSPRVEFWNELIHRCSGFLMRGEDMPAGFLDEAEAQARALRLGNWRAFRRAVEAQP